MSRVSNTVALHVCPITVVVLSYYIGDAMIFSFEDLSKVTNNFSKEKMIGKGGFGRVFRGKLRHSDVAVKVLSTVSETRAYFLTAICVFSFCAAGHAVNDKSRVRLSFEN